MVRKSRKHLFGLDECALVGRRYGVERAIAGVARAQHGVITRAQLIAIGLDPAAIEKRVERGRLTPIHRGVYLVGPLGGQRAAETAAILACSGPASVSHQSAAYLFGLPPYPHMPGDVHVTVIRDVRRTGITVHRHKLQRDETTEVDGVPVTTATRTILDLAHSTDLEHLVAEAYAKNLTSRPKLLALLARYPRRRGTTALRALLETTPARTRSDPERRMLALIRKARLPEPQTNVRLHNYEVDFLWSDRKLVVEVDALSTHSSPRAFERDRRKDAELTLVGYMVIRVTRRAIESESEVVIARIAAALAILNRRHGF